MSREIRLRKSAASSIAAASNGVEAVYAAIERAVGVADEARFPHRSVRRDECGNDIARAIKCGERDLGIGNWILWTLRSGTAPADCRLRMTLGATVSVEGRSQAFAGFNGPRN